MTVTINASTSSGLITTADNSGILGIQTAGTTALTISASQNVGIGTTSPINNGGYGGLSLNGTSGALFSMMTNGTETSRIASISNDTSIQCAASTGFISFVQGVSGGTERARIDSSGNLLVGLTSAPAGSGTTVSNANNSTWAFRTQSSAASFPNGILVKYTVATPNNGGNQFLYCEDATAIRAAFASNGGLVNYSGNDANLSDRREKTNFSPATSYLEKICAIPVQTFNYIDQNMEEDGGLTLGVVAQDVQAVAPELVTESNWASKDEAPKMRLSIYQTDLQYALMKCIQEQQAIIESLTQRITALEGAQA